MNNLLSYLHRSVLSIPSNREKMLLKSKELRPDVVMFDLEDSVPVEEKDKARAALIKFLEQERPGAPFISYRINPMDTPFAYRDIIEVMEKVGETIHSIVVPKVEEAYEIKAVEILISQIEKACGFSDPIYLEPSIETAKGMLHVKEIAFSSDRIISLVFGIADYSVSLGMFFKGYSGHGEEEEFYPGHRFHFPLSRMAMVAKARGIMAIDAPYGNFRDKKGLQRSCLLSRYLGYDGKWAIHPSQIEVINEVFSPLPEEVNRCKEIARAYYDAKEKGEGSVAVDGRMIDGATLRLALQLLERYKSIEKMRGI